VKRRGSWRQAKAQIGAVALNEGRKRSTLCDSYCLLACDVVAEFLFLFRVCYVLLIVWTLVFVLFQFLVDA
jgi:hypothetical protein